MSSPDPGGVIVEEDTSPEVVSNTCCLIDEGQRCNYPATSATFNKRLIKTTQQRRRQLFPSPEVLTFEDLSRHYHWPPCLRLGDNGVLYLDTPPSTGEPQLRVYVPPWSAVQYEQHEGQEEEKRLRGGE